MGCLAGLLKVGVLLLLKFFLSWLKFCEGRLFKFWFRRFALDWELLIILGLFEIFVWFEIVLGISGLFRGFINNGFLLGLSLRGFPFKVEFSGSVSFLFCLWVSFLFEGLLMESIFLSEFFLLISFLILFASSAEIELLWLLTEIESFCAASSISLLSSFKSLDSS